jgi:hypothetical protein
MWLLELCSEIGVAMLARRLTILILILILMLALNFNGLRAPA